MGSRSRTMATPSLSSLDRSLASEIDHNLEKRKTCDYWFINFALIDRHWQTFERLHQRGVGLGDALSRDLTLFVVGHDKQQVTGVGDGSVIVAPLIDAVRRPGNVE